MVCAELSRMYSVDVNKPRKHGQIKVVDSVCVVILNSPGVKVNSLNAEVMAEMKELIDGVERDPGISSVVLISGKPGVFIAGADIQMLASAKTKEEVSEISRQGQQLLGRMANSRKPYVAAIMGSCLGGGGGLEVALACHYRIAVKDKKTGLGLPEVMLGLLPGGAGTQRLPKLIPLPDALDMALTGKTVKADKARKLGLVDLAVDPLGPGLKSPTENTMKYLEDTAVLVAKKLANNTLKVDREASRPLATKLLNRALQINFVI